MSRAKIDSTGKATNLDGKAAPDEVVTEADVQEPPKLARLLVRILKDIAGLKRTPAPTFIDFEDIAVVAFNPPVQLQHNFNGRVRWWVVDWVSTGSVGPVFTSDPTQKVSTASTLILYPYSTGTVTIRVEKVG